MKQRVLLYSAGAVGLLLLWLVFVYNPITAERKKVAQESVALEAQLADFVDVVSRMPEYVTTLNQLRTYTHELQSTLYAKDEILQMLKNLNREARANELAIVDITPPVNELLELNRTTSTDEPLFLNITLTLTGNYVGFGKYVNELEKATFFRGINHCRITKPTEEESPVSIVVGFKTLLGRVRETS